MSFIKNIVLNLLAMAVVSLFIFIGTVSIITGRFPPDFKRLKATFDQAHKAMSISQKYLAQIDFDELEAKIDNGQLPGIGGLPAVDDIPGVGKIPKASPNKMISSTPPDAIEKRMVELEIENARMRTRLEALEGKLIQAEALLPAPPQ
ncbi:MAG: hypothetical protein V4736_00225 [Bdellovibrionota bacterium]